MILLITLLLLIGTGECLSSPAKKTPTTTKSSLSSSSSSVSTSVDESHFDAPLPERVEVLIAGGGLGGLATCIGLRNRGIDAHVIEASPTLLRGSTGTGIMISPNGFSALDSLSITMSEKSDSDEESDNNSTTTTTASSGSDLSQKMKGFGARIGKQHIRLTDPTGNVTKEIEMGGYEEKYGTDQYNVGWARAHEVLASSIPPEANAIHTGCKLESFEFEAAAASDSASDDDSVLVTMEDGRTVRASLLIGADGFGSKVRRLLAGDKKCRTKYNGQLLWNAIVPTDRFPTAPHGKGQVEFITCGNDGQAILAFDAGEGKTAWYLTLMEGDAPSIVTDAIRDGSFGGFGPRKGVRSALAEVYARWPMALECLAATPEDQLFERRQADRPRLRKWSSRSRSRGAGGRVVLMGDAAHPMIPSLGQGTMVTWEDAAELVTCLAPLSGNDGEDSSSTSSNTTKSFESFDASGVPRAVKEFVRRRAKRCANVQSLSRERRMGRTLPKFFPLKILAIFKMIRAKNGAGDLYGHISRDAGANASAGAGADTK